MEVSTRRLQGVFWVATHTDFQYIRCATHTLLWLNIFFLMFVSLIPFSAGLLGRYPEKEMAVLIYGSNMVAYVLLRYSMWHYATKGWRLIRTDLDPKLIRWNARLALFPLLTYFFAMAVALLSLGKGFGIWFSLALYFITPFPYILGHSYNLLSNGEKRP
jgi:uncharacterized membrane protein